jgi:signal transduction histidine kinase
MDSGRPGAGRPDAGHLSAYQSAVRDTTRLNQLFAILTEPAPIATVLDRVLITLSTLFGADIVALMRFDSPTTMTPAGAIGLPDQEMLSTYSCLEGSCARKAVRERTAILCDRLDGHNIDPRLLDLDVEMVCWVPVEGEHEVIGTLLLARCQRMPFTRSEGDLLLAMARRVGLVLERASSEEERRKLEARLRQAEKSESLARMAAAIAHHFNNKLTGVKGYLELALADLDRHLDPREDIDKAHHEAQEAASVGHLMLAYLGQTLRTRRRMDLVAACRTAIAGLEGGLPGNVRLVVDLPERELRVEANEADLSQILANLLANAAESMEGAVGEIIVRLTRVRTDAIDRAALVSGGWTTTAAECACLEIEDRGCGMDAATLGNAFDPFFTTKFLGRGLGLPVALGLLRANEGTMSVDSAPGRGSTFRLYLPAI